MLDAPRRELLNSIGLLILRLGIGGYLLTHGWGKVEMLQAGKFAEFANPIGIGSGPSLVLMVGAEFVCALLVMVGLATHVAAVPVVIAMGVAAFVVHASNPWTMGQGPPSKEPALLYLISFMALIFTGPGQFSLDQLIWRRRPGQPLSKS